MKATELRIGNLVQDRHSEECGMIDIVVLGIIDTMENHSYEPIPLTEDWLRRFGFEFDNACSWWRSNIELTNGDPEEIGYAVFNDQGNCIRAESIEYVHQLQNFYHALTGQELNLNKEDEKISKT